MIWFILLHFPTRKHVSEHRDKNVSSVVIQYDYSFCFHKQHRQVHKQPVVYVFLEQHGSRLPIEEPHCDITFVPNSSGEISTNAAHAQTHRLPKAEEQHQLSLAYRLYFNSQHI